MSLEGQYSKDINTYLGKEHFGYLITVCTQAEERCPSAFPGLGQRLHWYFDDPAQEATEKEKIVKFRQVRGQIEENIKSCLQELQ